MKKLLVLLSLVLMSCQANSKDTGFMRPTQLTPVSVTATYNDPIDQEISMGKISVVLPLAWVKQETGADTIHYVNKHKKNLVLLNKESCPMTYSECMISTLSGIMQSEVEILSVEEVVIDNSKFVYVVSRKDQVKIWSWIAYRNSNLYMLSCGGLEEDLSNQETCSKIASSIKLR